MRIELLGGASLEGFDGQDVEAPMSESLCYR